MGDLYIFQTLISFYVYAKNYESWLTVDKVIAIIVRLTILAHPVYARSLTDYKKEAPVTI